MRSLKEFITESVKTFDYTIKIAGEADKKFLDMFKYNLNKFDPISISEPKSTPIQKSPYGFPDLENESVTIIKANFRYPATEPMIQQVAHLLGYDVNKVRVIDTRYNDSVDHEVEQYENQMKNSPLLDKEELEDDGKEANKAYGESYLSDVKKQMEDSKVEMSFEKKPEQSSYDPFKVTPVKSDSPLSKINRPAKPQTGSSK